MLHSHFSSSSSEKGGDGGNDGDPLAIPADIEVITKLTQVSTRGEERDRERKDIHQLCRFKDIWWYIRCTSSRTALASPSRHPLTSRSLVMRYSSDGTLELYFYLMYY